MTGWMTAAEVEALPDGDYYLEERWTIHTVGGRVTRHVEYRIQSSVSPLPASGESTGSLPPPAPGAPSQETTR